MGTFRGNKSLGKAICPCGTVFQKKCFNHKYCCEKCAKIANREQGKLKTLQNKKPFKGDFVLDMETWTWKKNEDDT